MRTLSRFGKLCGSSAEVVKKAQSSCVELYGGCCGQLVELTIYYFRILSHFCGITTV